MEAESDNEVESPQSSSAPQQQAPNKTDRGDSNDGDSGKKPHEAGEENPDDDDDDSTTFRDAWGLTKSKWDNDAAFQRLGEKWHAVWRRGWFLDGFRLTLIYFYGLQSDWMGLVRSCTIQIPPTPCQWRSI